MSQGEGRVWGTVPSMLALHFYFLDLSNSAAGKTGLLFVP